MNETKQFKLPITEEVCNKLQRLGMDIDARLEVINKIFTNHANDDNAMVLDSVPFKKYHKEFEELQAEYTFAKLAFEESIKPAVYEKTGKPGVPFRWKIENFSIHEVTIEIA